MGPLNVKNPISSNARHAARRLRLPELNDELMNTLKNQDLSPPHPPPPLNPLPARKNNLPDKPWWVVVAVGVVVVVVVGAGWGG